MRVVPSWDEHFMAMAVTAATRSKDPRTQVGAILTTPDHHIISTGYNGFPPDFPETARDWEPPAKYDLVVHAEANCLVNCNIASKGSTLYTTMYPCKECAKLIAAARIKRVVFKSDLYKNTTSQTIFTMCDIEVIHLGVSE